MSKRPNILLIYTDQQRYDTIAALGNPVIRTPNLDRLVTAGVAFTQATTPSPVCLAARWSLHSGQWTTTHRCYSNHHPGIRPPTDLPSMLRQAGYRTGLVGKNHSFLEANDLDFWSTSPEPADSAGWEERRAWLKARRARYPRLVEEAVPGGVAADPERARTEAAMKFMAACGDAPFFLWLSFLYPHTPYLAPEPYFSMYQDAPVSAPIVEAEGLGAAGKPFRQQFHQRNNDAIAPFSPEQIMLMRRVYYGMITMIDAEIGRILDFLDEQGLAGNTLLVFSSDHGDYMGDHGLLTKSPALYDCLVRVPLVIRWPGQIDGGRRDARLASHVDLLPTFAAAAGVSCPQQAQGIDLLPFLRDGGQGAAIRPAVFSEYGVPGTPYDQARLAAEGLDGKLFTNPWDDHLPWEGNPVSLAGRVRMIRTERWKYVKEIGGTSELYDLAHDPHELTNLWNRPAYATVQAELVSQLELWKQELPGIEAG